MENSTGSNLGVTVSLETLLFLLGLPSVVSQIRGLGQEAAFSRPASLWADGSEPRGGPAQTLQKPAALSIPRLSAR